MKIVSTPPQRYRPRLDYNGDPHYSVQRTADGCVMVIRGNGEERHWRIELSQAEFESLMLCDRMMERLT